MDWSLPLTAVLCFAVGIFLGLLGGGGSILTVPILVYVTGLSAVDAIIMSLAVIGGSSALGCVRYLIRGQVNKRLVVLFSVSGIGSAFLGARLTPYVESRHLLLLFGLLMMVIGLLLLLKLRQPASASDQGPVICHPGTGISLGAGAGIGFLTGFLGVGGGFLIVPVIALMMKCSIYTAIGTSLAIIAVNSVFGILGHWGEGSWQWSVSAAVFLPALLGSWAGSKFSQKMNPAAIQSIFSLLVLSVGFFLMVRNPPF